MFDIAGCQENSGSGAKGVDSKYGESGSFLLHVLVKNGITVKTVNIETPRPATVVVLNIKQFYFTMK